MIATGLAVLLAAAGTQPDGLTRVRSDAGVARTVARLEQAARDRSITVFATIDHAANARAAGLTLRPTVVLIVGNPQVGTRLMECAQEAAIDLPLKLLVWEDANGAVWVGAACEPEHHARELAEAPYAGFLAEREGDQPAHHRAHA